MGKRKHLGELEQMILLAVLQLGDDAYGTQVLKELEAKAHRRVARGALYVTLDRLEGKALLSSRLGDATPGRGGRRRRYLEVTPAGVAALRRARATWMQLWEDLDVLRDPA